MVNFNSLFASFAYLSLASAAVLESGYSKSTGYTKNRCGKTDVFFTGLPPYHPLVIAQGYDPAKVEAALKADGANIRKAGYNLRTVLLGPEVPISKLRERMKGITWEGTGVGFGERGSNSLELTVQFTKTVNTLKEVSPDAPIVFNRSPNTTLEALGRFVPILGNCDKTPGKDLGFEVYCDVPSVCSQK
ncbi:hypothetical protein Slin15195_G038490 [Septoria linicola]|uniref:Uncharacterized protein n=1 Tax=Septoria linicola TaxID=215465 RepID=A0A9Q9AQ54_9PEZI|nr:hypothetical protein Slin15195_G038490 [Septoria linicola]